MAEFYFAVIETPTAADYIQKHGIDPELYGGRDFIPLADTEQAAADLLARDCVNADITPEIIYILLISVEIPDGKILVPMFRDDLPKSYPTFEGTIPPEYITGISKAGINIEIKTKEAKQ